ncbi:MAG: RIP metalloprotease RseP [Acidobacteriaceae bacterium]
MPFFLTSIISMLVVLGIMVLVHEFGHFAVAKLCGVRVEVFSIGFGKRLFGFKRGDTDYRLSLLPLGGYVKMTGETPGEATTGDAGEFTAHPRWQRVLIALAGPFANFILALGLMTLVYMVHNEVELYRNGPAVVDYVSHDAPATATGMHSGDTIVHFDTVENPTWEQVHIRSLLNLNQPVKFSYVHDGQRTNTTMVVVSKGNPDDFDLSNLGLVPEMQATPLRVVALEPGMPAQAAGLKSNDRIVSADGLKLHSVPALLAFLQDQKGTPVTLDVLRDNASVTLHITPKIADAGDGQKAYRLGFSAEPPPIEVQRLPFPQAFNSAVNFNVKSSTLIMEVLHRMFTRQVSVRSLSGPIGIAEQTGLAVTMPGWMPLAQLMAVISLNLGIFNLLPIPILDGGLIVLLAVESLLRRDLNQELKERIYQAAFVCLLLFAAFVMFNDITKLPLFSKLKP